MTWVDFWAAVLPPLVVALLAVISAVAGLAVAYLRAMQRKYDESMDRQALHSAVTTGVKAELEIDPAAPDKQIAAAAARYVIDKGAPDAVRAFGLSVSDLTRLVVSKVGEERGRLTKPKPC